ncbi:hypothetical protein BDB01DRAFT_770364 [Pilobolus umbonatus]|nr:hypothetical protein BDB01DRAFT_770364 [Pilobolus umbonatus]
MGRDEDIMEFIEVTGASVEVATNYLQIADGNVETAITLYLENGGDQMDSHSSPVDTAERPTSLHSDDEFMMTDEQLARQLQDNEEGIRAPIAPKHDILTGGDGLYSPSPIWSSRSQGSSSRPSVFNQGDSTTGITDFLNRISGEASTSGTGSRSPDTLANGPFDRGRKLAEIFRPPFDIMFCGNFEEARESAKEKNQWLLINIQNPAEFVCQEMNRDLWSDSFVKEIIRESFIFLQYSFDSPDGQRYKTFYEINGYPHVAIIDARTGERVKVWETKMSPTDFMMEITEFLEKNSPDAFRLATLKRPRVAKNISDMSEEEQLNAAIAASLNSSSTKSSPVTTPEAAPIEPPKEIVEESLFDSIKAVNREEPKDQDKECTRIQLRMGDGSRIIRRFLKTDPVRYIFEFVKADVLKGKNQPFELVFNRNQLIDVIDQSIADAGLTNVAVNCVLV